MFSYDAIKTMPRTRDGKMLFGLIAAYTARLFLNEGMRAATAGEAVFDFMVTGLMLFVLLLCMVRFNTERPLFEPLR